MHANIKTISFKGIDVIDIDVQVQILQGMPSFIIVGLADKSVAESKERIRAALASIKISLPSNRIIVNLSPADQLKEGSHYDLPIILALLAAMEIIAIEEISNCIAIGELSLNGNILKVCGVLPAAIYANANNVQLICPYDSVQEALWAGGVVIPARHLLEIINHFKGSPIAIPTKDCQISHQNFSCFSEIKGQKLAKRAIEIACAGGHNIVMIGQPGVGKSMLASRMQGILPNLSTQESLEVTMIHSIAGILPQNGLVTKRPYRNPHHSLSMPALIGGGNKAKPGEISLAHRGILFLDELPEFNRLALEALRQPLENGTINIARANHHIEYPAKIQLVAAMNPCKCGYLGNEKKQCLTAPKCAKEYMCKISGPILDRIDMFIEVPEVKIQDLSTNKEEIETSKIILARVEKAREIQKLRYMKMRKVEMETINNANLILENVLLNSDVSGGVLECFLTQVARASMYNAVDKMSLSARGYYKILKTARTIADMEMSENIENHHVCEALMYRNF